MEKSFLSFFSCPLCATPLNIKEKNQDKNILGGTLLCSMGHQFAIRDGIPDFASMVTNPTSGITTQNAKTVESFGFEWQWDHTPRTETDLVFRVFEKPNISKDFFKGKLVLDMGCGAGLQTRTMAQYGAIVIGVDLSDAVLAAYRNNSTLSDRICIARADIFRLPFAKETFDYVYCEGVLQHTKDPRVAFHQLVRYVKPGGQIFATFYTRREGKIAPFLLFRQPIRLILSRLPKKVCWYLCWLSIPLNKIPLLKHFFRKTIVLYDKRNPSNKATWCLNYDFYGPHKYQFYFRPSEILDIWKNAPSSLTILHSEYGYPLRGQKK